MIDSQRSQMANLPVNHAVPVNGDRTPYLGIVLSYFNSFVL
ncbi:hypothetical protein [Bartonella quintana]|nr:hypothetical protein [Bartonella quintana]